MKQRLYLAIESFGLPAAQVTSLKNIVDDNREEMAAELLEKLVEFGELEEA